jgi:transposase-like protein
MPFSSKEDRSDAKEETRACLAERGFDVSYETVRRWVLKFGPAFARNLRRLRPRPADTWHLDEMVVSIRGRRMYRAVDSEGEILDLLVQPKRDKAAALRLHRRQGRPEPPHAPPRAWLCGIRAEANEPPTRHGDPGNR